ncbi:UxaA family hydrolase [Desulfatitalea alkaliphila]|uniref:UxaA family hydrolase n=1 Tax=Desulfatitalea alkaliphila TaxID=2929485 RepID=A0AA41UKH1_9BACT|nr:UxaA family hydrolase [Desulfatitalea alkaliphila]MCJ8502304.1 UxaA family hydrolase [Desulfatitalea alkaliphila]
MAGNAILIDVVDNVAVTVVPVAAGEVVVGAGIDGVTACEAIPRHHKVALVAIAAGAPVVKYGEAIGRATVAIGAGAWVHTHNMAVDKEAG